MKRPCDTDIDDAIACLKDNGLDRVALWLQQEGSRASIRAAARRIGVTVSYYRRNVMKRPADQLTADRSADNQTGGK